MIHTFHEGFDSESLVESSGFFSSSPILLRSDVTHGHERGIANCGHDGIIGENIWNIYVGFLSHRATPRYHPFFGGGFAMK